MGLDSHLFGSGSGGAADLCHGFVQFDDRLVPHLLIPFRILFQLFPDVPHLLTILLPDLLPHLTLMFQAGHFVPQSSDVIVLSHQLNIHCRNFRLKLLILQPFQSQFRHPDFVILFQTIRFGEDLSQMGPQSGQFRFPLLQFLPHVLRPLIGHLFQSSLLIAVHRSGSCCC